MLINYLKIFRHLFIGQRVFALIKIVGLSVGLACCLIIALFVRHELSFDRFFANADRLYRVSLISTDPAGVRSEGAPTFFPLAPMLADRFPDVVEVARMRPLPVLINNGNAPLYEYEFKLVDPEFFQLFDFTWLEGDPQTALSGAADVVLTQSIAKKHFGAESPLGQTLSISQGVALRVTGVIEDLPANTHMNGSAFISMALRDVLEPVEGRTAEWFNGSYYTYVLLRPETNVATLDQELAQFSRDNIPAAFNTSFILTLDRVTDIHLEPKIGDMEPAGSKLNIAIFSAIGSAVLLIACINFINLTTAGSAQRIGEVGVRLALGASRSQLVAQFLAESVLFMILAVIVAAVLVELALPPIQTYLTLDLELHSLMNAQTRTILLSAALFLGLLAGWYPAMVLSGLRPVIALKNSVFAELKGLALRNVLVVLQFAIAIVLIVASLVIHSQMRFASSLDAGFMQDSIVVIRASNNGSLARMRLLKEELLLNPGVRAATMSESTPERIRRYTFVRTEQDLTERRFAYVAVDFDYFSVFEIELLAGRLPREDMPTDLIRSGDDASGAVNGSFVINEQGASAMGWSPEEAIGQLILRNEKWFRVIGVVSNTIESARSELQPAIYAVPQGLDPGANLSLKLDGSALAETLTLVDSTWKAINPEEPIVRSFLNDNIQQLYDADNQQMYLSFLFSSIAIVISCMGLLGLAAFNAERRTKEVGVRKVLGGSVLGIVWLLTSDFSRLVLISNLIAWPIAYFAMEHWLQSFAYRIDLTPLVFIGSGLIALCIAWATVGGTAAKAASAKPVLALRYE